MVWITTAKKLAPTHAWLFHLSTVPNYVYYFYVKSSNIVNLVFTARSPLPAALCIVSCLFSPLSHFHLILLFSLAPLTGTLAKLPHPPFVFLGSFHKLFFPLVSMSIILWSFPKSGTFHGYLWRKFSLIIISFGLRFISCEVTFQIMHFLLEIVDFYCYNSPGH